MSSPPNKKSPIMPEELLDSGKRLILLGSKSRNFLTKAFRRIDVFFWRLPLHQLKLLGNHPLKLIAVPKDPIGADPEIVEHLAQNRLQFQGESIDLNSYDFGDFNLSQEFDHYLSSFAFLRELSHFSQKEKAVESAERLMRIWLDRHGHNLTKEGWRADLWGLRIIYMIFYAPTILASSDLVYRSSLLNALVRGARHCQRVADKQAHGLGRINAWAGVVAAGLAIHRNEAMLKTGELKLKLALETGLSDDYGLISRSPLEQLELVKLLLMVQAAYQGFKKKPPLWLIETINRSACALLTVQMGANNLGSWQGNGPIAAEKTMQVIKALPKTARPRLQNNHWGYQRLANGSCVIVIDGAPPPLDRYKMPGHASTLALVMSDGDQPLFINCGGSGGCGPIGAELARLLRTSAAHSTLTINNRNSTMLLNNGRLGRGVTAVELQRQESSESSSLELNHDGYVKSFGLIHHRFVQLLANGKQVNGKDWLEQSGKKPPANVDFTIRFHLAPWVEAALTADNRGAWLQLPNGVIWQFKASSPLQLEQTVAIDAYGAQLKSLQLVIEGNRPQSAANGVGVEWHLRRE